MSRFTVRFWTAFALAMAVALPASAAKHHSSGASSAGQTIAPPPAVLSDADLKTQTIARVSAALNAITTLKADFTQADAKGISSGHFYLARPGRLRFEYNPPARILIVADGKRVHCARPQSPHAVRRQDQRDAPAPSSEAGRRPREGCADHRRRARRRPPRDHGGRDQGLRPGQITFIFDAATLDLQRWVVIDPTGAQTTVTLQNVEKGIQFADDTFEMPEWARAIGKN